jgi:hypothetical protein
MRADQTSVNPCRGLKRRPGCWGSAEKRAYVSRALRRTSVGSRRYIVQKLGSDWDSSGFTVGSRRAVRICLRQSPGRHLPIALGIGANAELRRISIPRLARRFLRPGNARNITQSVPFPWKGTRRWQRFLQQRSYKDYCTTGKRWQRKSPAPRSFFVTVAREMRISGGREWIFTSGRGLEALETGATRM